MATRKKPKSLEASLDELEALIQRMEVGEMPLEELLKHYAEAQRIAKRCAAELDTYELKVEELVKGENEAVAWQPFVEGDVKDGDEEV